MINAVRNNIDRLIKCENAFKLIVKGGGVQEKESLIGHRLEVTIFNPRDDRAIWYLSGASVPPGPVIPRVENANLKSMPIIDSHNP